MPGDRTEQASPRARQKAAEHGDRARSRDLMAGAAMLAGVYVLGALAQKWVIGWGGAYRALLELGQPAFWERTSAGETAIVIRGILLKALEPMGIVFLASLAGALAAGIAQGGGWTFNFEALSLKPERLNPTENAKNIFSLRAVVRLGKSLVPVLALGFFAVHAIEAQTEVPPLSTEQYPDVFAEMYNLLVDGAWIFLAWAGVDYVMEWRSREDRLRMSKQDVRDEFREMEGSPQIKARIRGLRRQMRRKQLKADISRASVVVTNPTHYAVALSFDFETMDPPRLLAKGRDLLAAQIREEAQWAGVPIVENPPLARSLYRQVEPGQQNPAQLGQIQLATFVNPGGLNSVGSNLFTATLSSGDPVLGNPGGTEGLGTLQQGYLENSNVDVVGAFVQMVLAQRAYESNSKVIRAADDMYSQVNNMAR